MSYTIHRLILVDYGPHPNDGEGKYPGRYCFHRCVSVQRGQRVHASLVHDLWSFHGGGRGKEKGRRGEGDPLVSGPRFFLGEERGRWQGYPYLGPGWRGWLLHSGLGQGIPSPPSPFTSWPGPRQAQLSLLPCPPHALQNTPWTGYSKGRYASCSFTQDFRACTYFHSLVLSTQHYMCSFQPSRFLGHCMSLQNTDQLQKVCVKK